MCRSTALRSVDTQFNRLQRCPILKGIIPGSFGNVEGVLIAGGKSIITKHRFADAQIHLEFNLPVGVPVEVRFTELVE